jgi:hypothetical protein
MSISIDIALGAASAATAAFTAAAGIREVWSRREEGAVAQSFKAEPRKPFSPESDPRALNEYLFKQVGKLSLREFAADQDVRSEVGRAVAQIDELLETPNPANLGDRLPSPHVGAAFLALDRRDLVGALAHLRLWLELELRQITELLDIPVTRRGPSGALGPLTKAGVLQPPDAEAFSSLINLGNRAVHGDEVDEDQARQAVVKALGAMQRVEHRLQDIRSRWA